MNADKIVDEISIDVNTQPPEEAGPWTCYVTGVVAEYLKDIPSTGAELNLSFAISGDVPLGSGLSSSASLEVAVARFVECVLGDYTFTGENGPSDVVPEKVRAIRCQKAENLWCHSPCGIMDQYISSAASSDEKGTLLCIDCRTNDFEVIKMKQDPLKPVVLVVTNSAVAHSIGGGEYPVRVQQCKAATEILQQVHGDRIKTLRDATVEDVLACEGKMDDVIYRRARHVVTENARVLATKEALLKGDYKVVGQQMNLSHVSMREDYETSCEEVDILVDLAQNYPGVFGSRLTGGGFGGCAVTLVAEKDAKGLMEHLQKEYKAKTGKDCAPFETMPAPGARVLAVDTLKQ
jgi:galactokinase